MEGRKLVDGTYFMSMLCYNTLMKLNMFDNTFKPITLDFICVQTYLVYVFIKEINIMIYMVSYIIQKCFHISR